MSRLWGPTGALLLLACASPQRPTEGDVRAIEDAAEQSLNAMSPIERAAFNDQVEQNVVREMQAKAHACGTNLYFSDEPKFDDRTVYVDTSASPEQLACVQKSYPFVKSSPK